MKPLSTLHWAAVRAARLLLVLAILAGASARAVAAPPLTRQDRSFLLTESLASRAELQFAETARLKSQDTRVKELANLLATDFAALDPQLAALAQAHGVTVPAEQRWEARHDAWQLTLVWPEFFDRYYVNLVAEDLLASIRHYKKAARSSADPDVQAFALKVLPDLEKRLDRAQHLVPIFGFGRMFGGDAQ